ncbi:MAG: LuxR C-terminal-related transcriptional regulator [Abditibacteriales bacterium]|nr:LuxR C-terminal-related transcriptional regulator [Abditibacteriales bacterium]MDW8364346.1 LuxR C-terminal-related transcriptional regulator [Abditibacteriales bacterium]
MRQVHLRVELPDGMTLTALRELLEMNDVVVHECEVDTNAPKAAAHRLRSIQLSGAELAVLKTFAYCETNQAIAERLNISVSTVKTHINRLFRKLRVRTRSCALGRALRLGLITSQDLLPPAGWKKSTLRQMDSGNRGRPPRVLIGKSRYNKDEAR